MTFSSDQPRGPGCFLTGPVASGSEPLTGKSPTVLGVPNRLHHESYGQVSGTHIAERAPDNRPFYCVSGTAGGIREVDPEVQVALHPAPPAPIRTTLAIRAGNRARNSSASGPVMHGPLLAFRRASHRVVA